MLVLIMLVLIVLVLIVLALVILVLVIPILVVLTLFPQIYYRRNFSNTDLTHLRIYANPLIIVV